MLGEKKTKKLTKNNWSSLKLPWSWNSPEHQCRACLKLSLTPPSLSPAIGRRAVQKFSKQFSFYVNRGVPLRAERGWLSLGEACCSPQAKELCRRLHRLWNPIPFSTKATAVLLQLGREQRADPGLAPEWVFHGEGKLCGFSLLGAYSCRSEHSQGGGTGQFPRDREYMGCGRWCKTNISFPEIHSQPCFRT